MFHSFINAEPHNQRNCKKKRPKIKIPPTEIQKYHPNCLVRESSPSLGMYVWIFVSSWFSPIYCMFWAFLYTHTHTHTNIFEYICQTFSGFFLIRSCSSERCPYTHTHTHTHYVCTHATSRERARSLALSLSLSLFSYKYMKGRGGQTKTTLVAAPWKKIDFADSCKNTKMHKFASQLEFN